MMTSTSCCSTAVTAKRRFAVQTPARMHLRMHQTPDDWESVAHNRTAFSGPSQRFSDLRVALPGSRQQHSITIQVIPRMHMLFFLLPGGMHMLCRQAAQLAAALHMIQPILLCSVQHCCQEDLSACGAPQRQLFGPHLHARQLLHMGHGKSKENWCLEPSLLQQPQTCVTCSNVTTSNGALFVSQRTCIDACLGWAARALQPGIGAGPVVNRPCTVTRCNRAWLTDSPRGIKVTTSSKKH